MSRNPEEIRAKLDRLRNRATLYELAIARGDESYLVAYCNRRGRAGIFNAVSSPGRVDAVKALTGTDEIRFAKRADDGATMGGWMIRFTGRTQRDAIGAGELPFIGDRIVSKEPTS